MSDWCTFVHAYWACYVFVLLLLLLTLLVNYLCLPWEKFLAPPMHVEAIVPNYIWFVSVAPMLTNWIWKRKIKLAILCFLLLLNLSLSINISISRLIFCTQLHTHIYLYSWKCTNLNYSYGGAVQTRLCQWHLCRNLLFYCWWRYDTTHASFLLQQEDIISVMFSVYSFGDFATRFAHWTTRLKSCHTRRL